MTCNRALENAIVQWLLFRSCPHNGVFGQYGASLIWTLERVVEENWFIRSTEDSGPISMPLDCFLFFADAGNGDLFGYSIVRGIPKGPFEMVGCSLAPVEPRRAS